VVDLAQVYALLTHQLSNNKVVAVHKTTKTQSE